MDNQSMFYQQQIAVGNYTVDFDETNGNIMNELKAGN